MSKNKAIVTSNKVKIDETAMTEANASAYENLAWLYAAAKDDPVATAHIVAVDECFQRTWLEYHAAKKFAEEQAQARVDVMENTIDAKDKIIEELQASIESQDQTIANIRAQYNRDFHAALKKAVRGIKNDHAALQAGVFGNH